MKYFSIFILFFVFACDDSKDESPTIVNDGILGKWQLEASKVSSGGTANWTSESNGEIYEFKSDMSFTLTNSINCSSTISGTYAMKDDKLSLNYTCGTTIAQPNFFMTFTDNKLILNFIGCIEECSYRYKPVE